MLHVDANASVEDLLSWSKDKLAGYKRPRDIVFLQADEMPRNATGKILHRQLKARLGTNNGEDSSISGSSA